MGAFEDLNVAGLRAIGFGAEWVDIPDYTAIPDAESSGVYLQGSPKALGYVAVRENVAKRTARVVITNAALVTTVYTITINGTDVDYDATAEAPADADELVAGIMSAVNADGTVGPIVTATLDPDDQTGMTILIVGDTSADYSIDATVAGGAGTLTANADACTFDVQIYTTPGGTIAGGSVGNPGGWVAPLDGLYTDMSFKGFLERFTVASIDRAKLVLENVAGHGDDGSGVTQNVAKVMIGPCVATSVT